MEEAVIHPRWVLIFVMVICCYWATGCSPFTRKASFPEPPAASYRVTHFTVTGIGDPERVKAAMVTPDFFKTTKALPLFGRLFLSEDYQGKAQTILLGKQFWQRRFGGNPAVIGSRMEVDGRPMTIIGIMPGDFDLPPGTEIWRPQESFER